MKKLVPFDKKAFVLSGVCLALSLALAGCNGKALMTNVEQMPIVKKALNDSSSVFYAGFNTYPAERAGLPIGIFDSGMAGISLLEIFQNADYMDNITGVAVPDGIEDFAGEDFQYLADQANMPYTTYPLEGQEDYLRELVVKDALFLLGNRYYQSSADRSPKEEKDRVKIIVVANTTANAYAFRDLKTLLELSKTGIKVIGVIDAGIDCFFDYIASGESLDSLSVGILAAPQTISSGIFQTTVADKKKSTGYKGFVQVVAQPAWGFEEVFSQNRNFIDTSLTAPRASYKGPRLGKEAQDIRPELMGVYNFDFENNAILYSKDEQGNYIDFQLNSAENYARFLMVSLLENLRGSKERAQMKSVLLGCMNSLSMIDTFNKITEELREYRKNGKLIYAPLIARDFKVIDPSVAAAVACYKSLRADYLLALRPRSGRVDTYISVPSYSIDVDNLDDEGALSYTFKYARKAGTEEVTTVVVPLAEILEK